MPVFISRAVAYFEWIVIGLLTWRLVNWLTTPENREQADFVHFFYVAGRRLALGLSPYDFVSEWGDSFNNPPWLALLVAPLSLLSPESAANCWLTINLALIAAAVVLAQRLCHVHAGLRRTMILFLVMTWWQPVEAHLSLGQSSLLVAASAFGAISAVERQRPWGAAWLLLIAAIKPQLVFLLAPGLCLWEWRFHE